MNSDSRSTPVAERGAAIPPNPVLLLGELQRELKTAGQMVKQLPSDPDHYHGNLRILFAALKRAQDAVDTMLEIAEAGPDYEREGVDLA